MTDPSHAGREPGTIVVAAAVIERDGHVLIARRPSGVHLEHLWEFPGGKVERGEDLRSCLAREIAEELGTTVSIAGGPAWRVVRHTYPDKPVEIHFFRCRLTGAEPVAMSASEIAWVAADELGRYDFPAADRDVVTALRALLAGYERPAGF